MPGLRSLRDWVHPERVVSVNPDLAKLKTDRSTHEDGRQAWGPAYDEQRQSVLVILIDGRQNVLQALSILFVAGRPASKRKGHFRYVKRARRIGQTYAEGGLHSKMTSATSCEPATAVGSQTRS